MRQERKWSGKWARCRTDCNGALCSNVTLFESLSLLDSLTLSNIAILSDGSSLYDTVTLFDSVTLYNLTQCDTMQHWGYLRQAPSDHVCLHSVILKEGVGVDLWSFESDLSTRLCELESTTVIIAFRMRHFLLCRIITPINGSSATSSSLLRVYYIGCVLSGGCTHSCLMVQGHLEVAPFKCLFSLEGGCKMHAKYRLPLHDAHVHTYTSLSSLTPPPPPPHSPHVVCLLCTCGCRRILT